MMTLEQIEQIAAFDGKGARVLSLCLAIEPAGLVRCAYRVVFEDLVKELEAGLEEAARADFGREVGKVREWLEGQPPWGRGLAVFSCIPGGLWRAEAFAVPIASHVTFDPSPDVAPLLELLDEYERYAVAVVDKEKARLLTVFAGEVEDSELFRDFVFGKTDQGGLSQPDYQRHHETHVHWHLEKVVRRLADLHRRRRFDRLILAGPSEATAELRRLLPATLERRAEERLLDEIIDLAGPAGRPTLGLEPTLAALWSASVRTLAISADLRVTGSECPNCDRLDRGRVVHCPTCGKAMRPVHDLAHRAMARAATQSARVDVLRGAAGHRLMDLGGGLAALLRYTSPVALQAASRGAHPQPVEGGGPP